MKSPMIGLVLAPLALLSALIEPGRAVDLPVPRLPTDSSGLVCKPATVRTGDTVRIDLPKPHGSNFAVVDPTGTYFFIAFNQPDAASPVQPIVPGSVFEHLEKIDFEIGKVQGINWSSKVNAKQPVFVKSGTYKVLVAPSLETEDPTLDGWCHVRFSRE